MSGNGVAVHNNADGPLRIVLVAPPYFDVPPKGYGGVEAVVADLADALVKRGHRVTLLGAGQPGTAAEFIPLWGNAIPDPLLPSARRGRCAIATSLPQLSVGLPRGEVENIRAWKKLTRDGSRC